MAYISVDKQLGVIIKVIPHNQQRYDTVGDWYFNFDDFVLEIKVSKMGNWKWEMLVAQHEMIEALLCLSNGVREEQVTAFDIQYEKNRQPGDESEPGDSIKAPYYKEHQFATSLECFMSQQLGVDWDEYEEAINSLVWNPVNNTVQ